jgi:AmmeMemoRadiSam system protein B
MRTLAMTILLATLAAAALGCGGCKRSVQSGPATSPPQEEAAPGAESAEEVEAAPAAETIKDVFWSQVAGQFYPMSKEGVEELVDKYLADAKLSPELEKRDIVGFISPHAGYTYSGPVAAWGYRQIQDRPLSTVVILGFNHGGSPSVSSVLPYDGYKTPLGTVPIDRDLRGELLEKGKGVLKADKFPFSGEHSIETQIPFIQTVLPKASIVPIIVAHPGGDIDEGLAKLLYEVVGRRKDVVVVASSDLSHYTPYDDAVSTDMETLGWIAGLKMDPYTGAGPGQNRLCGYFSVGVLLEMLQNYDAKDVKGTLVKYANSGDTSGEKDKGVVGYGVVAFSLPQSLRTEVGTATPPAAGAGAAAPAAKASPLSSEGRSQIESVARSAIGAALAGQAFTPDEPDAAFLRQTMGAIVVVHIDGRIQGLGKELSFSMPLYKAVAEAARSAVLDDPRYPTPKADKLADMALRIYAVTQVAPLPQFKEEDYSGDGLLIESPVGTGLLLPDEAAAHGWKKEEALKHGCRRANLMTDCTRESNIKKENITFSSVKGVML